MIMWSESRNIGFQKYSTLSLASETRKRNTNEKTGRAVPGYVYWNRNTRASLMRTAMMMMLTTKFSPIM
jgi:hypothetical protein